MIEYHEKTGLPGVQFFDCPSGLGTINKVFCADSHSRACTKEFISERKRPQCRFCPIGKLHCGKQDTTTGSRLYGSLICSRCQRTACRLIGPTARICPSCFNRQSEVRRGSLNAKKNPLKKIRKYRDVTMTIIKDGQASLSTSRQVMTLSEAVLSTLISTSGNLVFAWAGNYPV